LNNVTCFDFRRSVAVWAFLSLSFCTGCHAWRAGVLPLEGRETALADRAPGKDEGVAEIEKLLAATQTVRRADGTSFSEPTEGWFLEPTTPDEPSEYRWRHAGLDRWYGLPPSRRPDLAKAQNSSALGVAAAAKIGLAREFGSPYAEAVADLAADPTLALATRRAAVETLARQKDAASKSRIDRLYAELTSGHAVRSGNYQPLLHVELLLGLARRDRPSEDPRVLEALAAESGEVRGCALELLAAGNAESMPREALALLADSDPNVRHAALAAAAALRAPQALSEALRAARDPEARIRLAAIAALGAIGGPEAARELREIAAREGELFQAAAVTALAQLGEGHAVRQAALDKSWRVRRAAAAALAADRSPEGVAALRRLLGDKSTEVQLRAIESISSWPVATAGPLLLLGLEARSYATRAAAHAALAKKWPRAARISSEELRQLAPPRESLAALKTAWEAEFGKESLARTSPVGPHEDNLPGESPAARRDTTAQAIDVALLTKSLGQDDKHKRLAAASELARHGYESGTRALESLTFDLDPEIRRRAAAAVGSLEDPLLLAPLVRLLDDEPPVRLAALKALRQIVGRDVAAETEPRAKNASEEAERWKAWYERGGD
jgi:HEAT repeat protein